MRRRDFIKVVAGSTVGWPLTARAQQHKRVAALIPSARDDANYLSFVAGFKRSLRSLG
jgi:hypothetical protein